MKRIYVDFNTMQTDTRERVFINTGVHPELARELLPGMSVILFDECLEVGGTVEFDSGTSEWYGVPDWTTRRDL